MGESQQDKASKKAKKNKETATIGECFNFIWDLGLGSKFIFLIGCVAAVGSGAVYPLLAWLFSGSFSILAGASNGLQEVREIAFSFMGIGVFSMTMALFQTGCLDVVATRATRNFRTQWFQALLRQDTAFFDVYDVAGLSSTIGPNSAKFQRGMGKKLGEGIQFFTSFVGGVIFAFFSSWKTALLVLGVIPFTGLASFAVVSANQNRSANADKAYRRAGGVAYSTVSSIRTVLSLNGLRRMIEDYTDATAKAFNSSVTPLLKEGVATGSMIGSFILLYAIMVLFGAYLLYNEVRNNGCDPSDSDPLNMACGETGTTIFGAMLGLAFAGQGIAQTGQFIEAFTACRVAVYPAIQAISRKKGASAEIIYNESDSETDDAEKTHSSENDVEEGGSQKIRAKLPKYEIDSQSTSGLRPLEVRGEIEFSDVSFAYPTRPDNTVLKRLNLKIPKGKTIALVGPSGSGKSSTVALIERFYDPIEGKVEIDGIDIRDINVAHLRSMIGYVGQEPVLFNTSILENIRHGNPNATTEQISEAAKAANAHQFITSFPDGYQTHVGDKGSQLSGGQKQRISLARCLVS